MENIKNIVFDLGGVLIGLDAASCIAAFDRLGCKPVSQYVADHRTEDLFYDIEMGRAGRTAFCEWARKISGSDATDDSIVAAWNALLTPMTVSCWEHLQALRRSGRRLFLLSNTNAMHWQHCTEHLFHGSTDELFERVFLSYEMGLSKPDPRIFEAVLSESALRAEETLFIDDNADNIHAAQGLGIRTFLNENLTAWEGMI